MSILVSNERNKVILSHNRTLTADIIHRPLPCCCLASQRAHWCCCYCCWWSWQGSDGRPASDVDVSVRCVCRHQYRRYSSIPPCSRRPSRNDSIMHDYKRLMYNLPDRCLTCYVIVSRTASRDGFFILRFLSVIVSHLDTKHTLKCKFDQGVLTWSWHQTF